MLTDPQNANLLRLGCFLLALLSLWLLERRFPHAPLQPWRGRALNLGFAALNTGVLRVLGWLLPVALPLAATQWQFGLLHQVKMPVLLETLIAVIALDLLVWGQHRLMHAYPWLWRLHRVHHSAQAFDVSLGLRFHPMEVLVSVAFKVLGIALLGASALSVLLFEIALNAGSLFEHSNLRISARMDRYLRWLIVTPAMHRVHHSTEITEQQSNFGFLLSCWDRIFKRYRVAATPSQFGVEGYPESTPPSLRALLKQPFN